MVHRYQSLLLILILVILYHQKYLDSLQAIHLKVDCKHQQAVSLVQCHTLSERTLVWLITYSSECLQKLGSSSYFLSYSYPFVTITGATTLWNSRKYSSLFFACFLVIWEVMIVSQYVVYHNTHRNQQYEYHDIYTVNYCHCQNSSSTSKVLLR